MDNRPLLKKGSQGPEVRQLQDHLRRAGFLTPESGTFDDLTRKTVMTFQEANGLEADGIVGPQTWAALEAVPALPIGRRKAA